MGYQIPKAHKTEIPVFKQKRDVVGQCQFCFDHWVSSLLFSNCPNNLKYTEITFGQQSLQKTRLNLKQLSDKRE